MAAQVNKEIELEIAYVLFIDIVGYSKLSMDEQRRTITFKANYEGGDGNDLTLTVQ